MVQRKDGGDEGHRSYGEGVGKWLTARYISKIELLAFAVPVVGCEIKRNYKDDTTFFEASN